MTNISRTRSWDRLFRMLIGVGCLSLTAPSRAADQLPEAARAPILLELRDQFDVPQRLEFPRGKLTLLTIADREGSEQIDRWVRPLKERFGERIDIRGIADVSKVPGWLRGLVRKRFQKERTYPVMMDWSGAVVTQFEMEPGQATILLLDRKGHILERAQGAPDPSKKERLSRAIETALPD